MNEQKKVTYHMQGSLHVIRGLKYDLDNRVNILYIHLIL